MRKINEYIDEKFNPEWDYVIEMANIGHPIFNNIKYTITTHGIQSGDREHSHIHIYLNDDKRPFFKFNFEIALDEILCYDEINIIRLKDSFKNKNITNRNKCSWNGYTKLYNDFEKWLYSNNVDIRGEYIDNLDAIIYWYNQESGGENEINNPLLNYIRKHGMKILNKNIKYFYTATV